MTVQQVQSELRNLPLDGVLGCLGRISLAAVQAGDKVFDADWQGGYLNAAIADSFPCTLKQRVPYTSGRHLLIHEHNLAWLAHQTVMNCRPGTVTPQISPSLSMRVCRLLLISNDLLTKSSSSVGSDLRERRAFVLDWLRHHQFNHYFTHPAVTLLSLARQYHILASILPRYFATIENCFALATRGVSLRRYFEILALFSAEILSGGNRIPWFPRYGLVPAQDTGLEETVAGWTRKPTDYRDAANRWSQERPITPQEGFDLVVLRQSPLIEARPEEIVCPVFPLLLAKIQDEPFFMLSDYLAERQRAQFHEALGQAYQDYAHSLVGRIAASDSRGQWSMVPVPPLRDGGELTDSLLVRRNLAVVLEHKGGRPGTAFLTGGGGHRVLGPSDDLLDKLDGNQPVTPEEGRESDEGILTRGLWQQTCTSGALSDFLRQNGYLKPDKVFPLITNMADIRVDSVARRAYLDPLIERAHLYPDPSWERPQWVNVTDLEHMAQAAEGRALDLEALLEEKAKPQYRAEQFDHFLIRFLGGFRPCKRLLEVGKGLMGTAAKAFFRDLELEDE